MVMQCDSARLPGMEGGVQPTAPAKVIESSIAWSPAWCEHYAPRHLPCSLLLRRRRVVRLRARTRTRALHGPPARRPRPHSAAQQRPLAGPATAARGPRTAQQRRPRRGAHRAYLYSTYRTARAPRARAHACCLRPCAERLLRGNALRRVRWNSAHVATWKVELEED
eukprot:COSAG02_NODE_2508_length_8634_cov_2.849326_8_plen_167_part_00